MRNVRSSSRIYSQQENKIPLLQEELGLIFQKLKIPNLDDEEINALDPFCQDGNFLKLLKKHFSQVNTYGIEEDPSLYSLSKQFTTKTVLGRYENVLATNGVFSLLFLNPPAGAKNPVGIPREAIALGDLTFPGRYLHAGSVLIFIVDKSIIPYLKTTLPQRFIDISYFNISNNRVCIMGIRSKGRVDKELAKQQRDAMDDIAFLDLREDIFYEISPSKNKIITFRNKNPEKEELAENISHSSLWKKISEILTPESRLLKTPKPMLHLNEARIAIITAAGVLNKQDGDHYRVGITKKIKDTMTLDDEDSLTTLETERHVSRVRIYHESGIYDLDY